MIPEKDISSAAKTIRQLFSQPEKLMGMGKNGAMTVKNNFSNEIFVEKFKELCEVLK